MVNKVDRSGLKFKLLLKYGALSEEDKLMRENKKKFY